MDRGDGHEGTPEFSIIRSIEDDSFKLCCTRHLLRL